MAGELINYFSEMGISPLNIAIMMVVMIWDLVWKLKAMWKAARKNSSIWFVILLLFNTAGILPILYLYVFSEMKKHKSAEKSKRKKRK